MGGIINVIEETVRKRFPVDAIDAVYVSQGEDSDGDRILKVIIVLKQDVETLDGKDMIGLVRHIRTNLVDYESSHKSDNIENTADFPLISYMSKREYTKFKSEAA